MMDKMMSNPTEKVIRLNFPAVPTLREWLFSCRVFASAMLAVYISLKIGLTHPFWACGTCFVIASPMAGAVRSKGVYRSLGTIMAGLMVVIITPLLANYRPLYAVMFGLFAAVCMYISMLDRTPRAYIFMLSGYTAAIVGTPMLMDIHNMTAALPFDTAACRVQEIIIALWCSSLVHGLFFPQSVGDALLARLDQITHVAQQWAANVLAGVRTGEVSPPYRQLAQGITELRLMATHLPFDNNHNIRWAAGMVMSLHDRLSLLVPIISGLENRLNTLRNERAEVRSDAWRALLGDIADWCLRGLPSQGRVRHLRNRIQALLGETESGTEWGDLLRVNFAGELNLLLDTFEACFRYRFRVEVGIKKGALQDVKDAFPPVSDRALYADRGQAFLAAAGVFFSTVLGMAFWIITDWPIGFQVATFAAIMSSIFAALDNPASALKMAFWFTFYSVPVAMFYLLVGVPSTHTMETLILVLAPFFLICGVFLGRPATAGKSLVHLMSVVGMLMLYDFGQQDIENYFNGQSGQLIGIAIAFFVTSLIRTAGVQRLVRRIVRTGWGEMARMAAALKPVALAPLAARMTDRVSLLVPRLAAAKEEAASLDLMEDVRISVNVAYLLNLQPFFRDNGLEPEAFMKALSAYFMGRLRQAAQDGGALLAQLDRLLYQVCALPPSQGKNEAVSALAGIRQDMFPEALFLRAPAPKKEVQ